MKGKAPQNSTKDKWAKGNSHEKEQVSESQIIQILKEGDSRFLIIKKFIRKFLLHQLNKPK